MNSDNLDNGSPSLPPSILYPTTLVFILLQIIVMWRINDRVANFVIFATWSRYVISVYHVITFKPLFGGMSLIAFSSVGMVALGLAVLRPRDLCLKFLVPCYMIVAVVVASGLANSDLHGIINVTVKFGYLIVVTLAVFEALWRLGEQRFMPVLLWAFVLPLALQALSIILGIDKQTEGEGSASFIGGYSHEADFSVILVTCFIVACFCKALPWIVRNGILSICLVGIVFANYRTTMIAIVPMALVQFAFGISSRFVRDQRTFVGAVTFAVGLLAVVAVHSLLQQRFQDVATVAESRGMMIKPPAQFSADDKRQMSGRPYIWSTYLYAYSSGSFLQHVLGFGPESWSGVMKIYAHNTLVSYLYEYGVIGVIVLIFWWVTMLAAAWRIRRGPRAQLLAAHVSFILINMATMPIWMIEGNILYGIICGYTLYLLNKGRKHALANGMKRLDWAEAGQDQGYGNIRSPYRLTPRP